MGGTFKPLQSVKLEIVGNRGNKLVKAEFATIAVAHNIRKMITIGYCVCSEVAVG